MKHIFWGERGLPIPYILSIIFCVLFSGLWLSPAYGQEADGLTPIKPLQIGDTVPDEVWNLKNQTLDGKTITLSDYKDKKLIILDFWATWCGACIGLLPKMDSIQRELADDMVVLPVTSEGKTVISTFFGRRNKLGMEKSHLTYITDSEKLVQLFPYSSLPQYVWIKDGKVYAISDFDVVNRTNIKKILANEDVFIQPKGYFSLNYDKSEPLFFNKENVKGAELIQHSTWVGYVEGIHPGYLYTVGLPENSPRVEDASYRRITARNQSMVQLFQLSFSNNKRYFSSENTIIRSTNREHLSSDAIGAAYLAWLRDGNSYCYELIVPVENQYKAWGIMQSELHGYFDKYVAFTEKQVVPSICLIRTSNSDKIRSKGGDKINSLDGMGGRINQYKLSLFTAIVREKGLGGFKKPVVNLTNYPYPVEIEINAKMHDINDLNKALARYDLKFVEQDREVEVLVIDDKEPLSMEAR